MKDPILPPEPLPNSTAAVDAPGRAPTPGGAALAGARVPGGPTLPEWDPASLSLLVQRLANELYQAPPDVAEPSLAAGQSPRPDTALLAPLSTSPQSIATSGPFPTSTGVPHSEPWGASLPAPNAVPVSALAQPVPELTPSSAPTGIAPVLENAPGLESAPLVEQRSHAPTSTPPVESAARGATPVSHHGADAPAIPDTSTVGAANPFMATPSFAFLDEGVMRVPFADTLDVQNAPTHSAPTHSAPMRDAPMRDEVRSGASGGATQHERREPALQFRDEHSAARLDPLVDWKPQGFDAYAIREEFPILKERVHGGKRLVWLDNAATTQKPQAVIDRLKYFYEHENSNIHRAAHALAARATDAYESARETVKKFINAGDKNNIVFVRGTTEGINLVAQTWGKKNVGEGDEILLTNLEHHANIVPWQMLANEKGAKLKVAPVDNDGQIILSELERLLGPKVKLVAMPQVSNALGTITPAQQMIAMAHRYGAKVVLDGAQSVSHMKVDVQALDCDFFVFSGHKIFAPTGIGAVYGKPELLEASPPYQGGGNMIQDVTFERTVYQGPPMRFEAGTGNIADAVGLGAALDWVTRVGIENIDRHEHDLLVYATERLRRVPGLRIYGTAKEKAGVISFTLAGHTTADVSAALDKEGIAVRGGHHCAQPILRRFGLESSVRASFAPYNVREDVDALVDALLRMQASGSASR